MVFQSLETKQLKGLSFLNAEAIIRFLLDVSEFSNKYLVSYLININPVNLYHVLSYIYLASRTLNLLTNSIHLCGPRQCNFYSALASGSFVKLSGLCHSQMPNCPILCSKHVSLTSVYKLKSRFSKLQVRSTFFSYPPSLIYLFSL